MPKKRNPSGLVEAVEALVDRTSVIEVLEALAEMADGKADHVAQNWGDRAQANAWTKASTILDRAAASIGKIKYSMIGKR